jgi:hypothetical protein
MHQRKPASLALVAFFALVGLVAAGCAPADPSLQYLQSQPENDLVYPGASLISTTTQGPGFPVNGCCIVDRKFSSGAAASDVGIWYSAQLAQRDWASDVHAHQEGGSLSYSWHKPALDLYLDLVPAAGGVITYTVSLQTHGGDYQLAAPCEALRRVQEASLAPPGATAGVQAFVINKAAGGGGKVEVTQSFVLDSPKSDIVAFYVSALTARGWTSISISPSDHPPGVAAGKWAKGPVVALLGIGLDIYTFELSETVDTSGSPVPFHSP